MKRGAGFEIIFLSILSLIYFLFMTAYTIIPLGTNYDKLFGFDFILQLITIVLAWSVPFVAWMGAFFIFVWRESMIWLYLSWTIIVWATVLIRALYEASVYIFFCSKTPQCHNEALFVYRMAGSFILVILLTAFVLVSSPLSDKEIFIQHNSNKEN